MVMNAHGMMSKVSGVPVCLVALAVVAESIFGDVTDFAEVPLLEMLIVAVAAPLALYFAKKRSSSVAGGKPVPVKATQSTTPNAGKKIAPWRQASASHSTYQAAQTRSQNSIAEKARLDSLLKEGKLEEACALLANLAAVSEADAVSYNMVISACAKAGDVTQSHL